MKTILKTVLIFSALSFSLSSFAAADDECTDCSRHHGRNLEVSFSPRYYGLNKTGYSSAFTNSGLNAPKSGAVGLEFSFYKTMPSYWQIGLGFGDVAYSNDNGSNTGEYDQGYFGLWLGRDFPINPNFDISVGSLFAVGYARTEVLSTALNGRTDEESFILAPKILAAYKIAPWLKIGLSASYFEPLAQNDTVKGQNLTTGNISLHGASGGFEFIIGRFWDKKPEAQL